MLQERQLPGTSLKCNCLGRSADKGNAGRSADKGNAVSFLLILKAVHIRPEVKKMMLLLPYHSINAVLERGPSKLLIKNKML